MFHSPRIKPGGRWALNSFISSQLVGSPGRPLFSPVSTFLSYAKVRKEGQGEKVSYTAFPELCVGYPFSLI